MLMPEIIKKKKFKKTHAAASLKYRSRENRVCVDTTATLTQIHERHGEIDGLFPVVSDGKDGHHQIRSLYNNIV